MKAFVNLLLLTLFIIGCAHSPNPKTELTSIDRFNTTSELTWLKETVRVANCVNRNADFINEVKKIEKFNFTSDSGEEVAKNLLSNELIVLEPIKHWNPFSKMIAENRGNKVVFNTWKNPRPIAEMVNTGIHERLHLWYSHNGNYKTQENLESVPYKVGDLSEKYVQGCL